MNGKIIGAVCFLMTFITFLAYQNTQIVTSMLVVSALFWVIGSCQSGLEKMERIAEEQTGLLLKQQECNKRMLFLLEKIAGEKHQDEDTTDQDTE